uniref:Uncharacterized protein n=1 Tax=Sphaerodactylus townsendi TaxID=933632 RepID=A0ACB8EW11_9SAUR
MVRMSSGRPYHEPSISVHPGLIVALGENATIYCKGYYEDAATFYLYKEDQSLQKKFADAGAVFTVTSVNQSNQGSYSCRYCYKYNRCSFRSDKINLQLAAQVYPKPFISVEPSGILTMGETASIHCDSENNSHTDFYLYKQGTSFRRKTEAIKSSEAVFHLTHGGIYWCTYCFDSNSGKQCSNFSDNVCINVADPKLGTPSISVRPERHIVLGSDVTIECEGPENGLNFSLHKAGNPIASQASDPSSNVTKFALPVKRLGDGGNYTCRFHHRENPCVWSESSNPVELVVTGPQISESQVVNTTLRTDAKEVCDETPNGGEPEGIIYAVLNQDSLKIKRTSVPDVPSDSCFYASVAVDRNVLGR